MPTLHDPTLHDLIEKADENADAVRRWIDKQRPKGDIGRVLNETAAYKHLPYPSTALIASIATKVASATNELVPVLLNNGADANGMMSWGDEFKVSPLDFAISTYLGCPAPIAFKAVEELVKKDANYGDGWKAGFFDVGPRAGDAAHPDVVTGAAARVLAFAECIERHEPDPWDRVCLDSGAIFLANALNGFAMPYVHDNEQTLLAKRSAMRAWCGPKVRPGSVADVVLKLQGSAAVLDMMLKSVDPQDAETCGNNAAYQAFIALNAVPLYEVLARGATEFSDLKCAALAGSSLSAAHLISSRVHERIATFARQMGPAQNPVQRSSQTEYLHRVAAAVAALLPEELANRLYAVLPNESLVPYGNHVHRACSLPDHESFINCLVVDCAGVLRGERPDLLIDALGSARGVRSIWQQHLLACVDQKWESLKVTVPGESRMETLEKVAKRRTPDAERISDDLMERIDERLKDADFKRICDAIRDQREIVTGQFCNFLTATIVESPPSFFAEAGATKKAVESALQGRAIKIEAAVASPSVRPPERRGPQDRTRNSAVTTARPGFVRGFR
jgi:hypothetical protein